MFSPSCSFSLHFYCLISETHIFLLHAPGLGSRTPGSWPREGLWLRTRGYRLSERTPSSKVVHPILAGP